MWQCVATTLWHVSQGVLECKVLRCQMVAHLQLVPGGLVLGFYVVGAGKVDQLTAGNSSVVQ